MTGPAESAAGVLRTIRRAQRAQLLFGVGRYRVDRGRAQPRPRPDNAECAGVRAIALTGLGRRAAAESTSTAALARYPEDANAHAIRGYVANAGRRLPLRAWALP